MKKNILIIDDNPQNCEDYIVPLREQYNVTTSMSLHDAKRKVLLLHYDLIVIDIMMPTCGISGNDDLKAGLSFYEEILKPLKKERPLLRILFWSHLSQNAFNLFFTEQKPSNVDFVHKETHNKNHLFEEIKKLLD